MKYKIETKDVILELNKIALSEILEQFKEFDFEWISNSTLSINYMGTKISYNINIKTDVFYNHNHLEEIVNEILAKITRKSENVKSLVFLEKHYSNKYYTPIQDLYDNTICICGNDITKSNGRSNLECISFNDGIDCKILNDFWNIEYKNFYKSQFEKFETITIFCSDRNFFDISEKISTNNINMRIFFMYDDDIEEFIEDFNKNSNISLKDFLILNLDKYEDYSLDYNIIKILEPEEEEILNFMDLIKTINMSMEDESRQLLFIEDINNFYTNVLSKKERMNFADVESFCDYLFFDLELKLPDNFVFGDSESLLFEKFYNPNTCELSFGEYKISFKTEIENIKNLLKETKSDLQLLYNNYGFYTFKNKINDKEEALTFSILIDSSIENLIKECKNKLN